MYYVYAIGDPQKIALQDYSECYIGVTNNLHNRWKNGHIKSKYPVAKAIYENSWQFETNMITIFSGEPKECFDLESKLRPLPLMGLNEASGGRGGHTKYTPERNKKISNALKGVAKNYGAKISEAMLKNESAKGAKNAKALKWILKNPNGVEYHLHGELFIFCKNNDLSANTLRMYLNQSVPNISPKYRDYGNVQVRQIRNNTTGWALFKEN
jgi:hypothetical protein